MALEAESFIKIKKKKRWHNVFDSLLSNTNRRQLIDNLVFAGPNTI